MFKSDLSAKGLISVALLLGPVTGFSAESYQKVGDDLSGELAGQSHWYFIHYVRRC